jgi:hypothetical protein
MGFNQSCDAANLSGMHGNQENLTARKITIMAAASTTASPIWNAQKYDYEEVQELGIEDKDSATDDSRTGHRGQRHPGLEIGVKARFP